ncbi:MAG: hypothetical protein ACO225_08495 [Ilumatobacteraceae bacterium]
MADIGQRAAGASRRQRRRDTERYLHMAAFVDIVHMPLVIGLIVMGATSWRGPVFYAVLTTVIVVQVGLLGCPCMLLSGWLRRKHDPSYVTRWSLTAWLYQRYGARAGIAVFVFFALAALGVRAVIV